MENIQLSKYEFDRLELFLTCGSGWDGADDSKATTHKIIAECLQVLTLARAAQLPAPSLVMGYGGEICVLWQDRKLCSLVEVCGDNNPLAFVDMDTHMLDDTEIVLDQLAALPQIVIDGVRAIEENRGKTSTT